MAEVSLELAISAIRAGRKEEGRQLLNLLIQQNPNNEMAWLWMSSVVNTDEQRARCLYHVLAINPNNQLARKGLSILGIVVTDSRPVKIPRDSQPIPIPKPSSDSGPHFPHEKPAGPPPQTGERRPFRIDPESIVRDLPFTPVNQPFSGTTPPGNGSQPPDQPQQKADSHPSTPVPPPPADSEPHPAQPPSQPVQPVPPPPPPPVYYPPPPGLPPSGQETRPTQPFQPPQMPAGPAYPGHGDVTMGMPTQYLPPTPAPSPGIHSNFTQGMPFYPPPGQQPVMGASTGYSAATLPLGYPAPPPDYRQPARPAPKPAKEEDEEEVNILAVIIFGALSVTALGGLGMLILLMFTTG
ncbi:MAG: hypothetical protein D6784_14340 [Chloroflexi bacterium]|nr:MAG: hypothetical protein D6784_14340 [Chloroflexota bacterium]